jgi:hypothetical protein
MEMEILLTGVLLAALLFLGLLISTGNERQRKAIDELRKQVESWTEQDIKIKREKLAREINVPDALGWLEKVSASALGSRPETALGFSPGRKAICSPLLQSARTDGVCFLRQCRVNAC